ncbi:hypothetical protein [uncultured Massilia sp.]|uniref:hypothetical protein n=1 Tax=uncultured Massilia sp. TaxID=169973 RepID=UPI0025FB319C|nr:hypothetical protein [uncultured Massilia sp.]
MNVAMISHGTLAETLREANILATLEGPGLSQTYVCERDGADILVIADPVSGDAMVVHPCSEDAESGGSIHDHARASIV